MEDIDIKIDSILKEITRLKLELYKKEEDLKKLLFEKYNSCKHILIISNIENDQYDGRNYFFYGCIKCGLNTEIKKFHNLTSKEKTMYLYLKDINFKIPGIYIELDYNFYKARKLWIELKNEYPNLSDDILIKVFLEKINKNSEQDVSKVKVREKLDFGPRNLWDYP